MVVWNEEEKKEMWRRFFSDSEKYGPLVREMADNYPETSSVYVDFSELADFSNEFADYIINDPMESLKYGNECIKDLMYADRIVPLEIHLKNIPEAHTRIGIRSIRASHLNKLISLEGLIRQVTEVRPKLIKGVFRCQRCKVLHEIEQKGVKLSEPQTCEKERGGCGRAKSSTNFILIQKASEFIDTQKIELQEAPEGLPGGVPPERIAVEVEGDLTDMVYPGDRATFHGVLSSRALKGGNGLVYSKYLKCLGIEREKGEFEEINISPEDEELIMSLARSENLLNRISQSISPRIKGMEVEKLALALQLFGGVRKKTGTTYRRGDIHILFIGDPGTGKSQLLTYISKMTPRGVFTTGKSATAAGLTAAAVPDEHETGRWNLEAGALVLADNGVACIDEIDKMNKQDQTAIHEAMEQQRVSVTKAGIHAVLQSRCSVLGAANPKWGRFRGDSMSLMDEVTIGPTILDRFDLIFTIRDLPDLAKDSGLAEHVLQTHRSGEIRRYREKVPHGKYGVGDTDEEKNLDGTILDAETLKKYIAYAKKSVFPILTREAMDLIKNYYVELRAKSRDVVTSTPRQLEGLIRLAEACAKAHLSANVTTEHAKVARDIVDYYLKKELSSDFGVPDIDMISTTVSHSQRLTIDMLIRTMTELENENEDYVKGGIPRTIIIDRCEGLNIRKEDVLILLKKLKERGELYSPGRMDGVERLKLVGSK